MLNRFGKAIAAAAVTATLIMPATPAFADGLHLMPGDPVWNKGCVATFSMDDRVAGQYGAYIAQSHSYISPYTGVEFVEVPVEDSSAMIKYTMEDNLSMGGKPVAGLGSTDGTVRVVPVAAFRDVGSPMAIRIVSVNLITHETLHVFGLAHDPDTGEVMNATVPADSVEFGPGDKKGMAYISGANGCDPSAFYKPIETDVPEPPASAVTKGVAFTSRVVKVRVPANLVYNARTGKTFVTKSKTKKVTAKSDGTSTWVRFNTGWGKVPYRYSKSTNMLTYSEAIRLTQGIPRDLLGGVPARVVG